jgi:AcrR family transcriptional regulator
MAHLSVGTRGARRRPGPRSTAHRSGAAEPTRRALFGAGAREFAAHGFEGASVDRIAAAARLNKAMIYYHFGSKAKLYAEILRDMFSAVGARVRGVAASAASPEDKIRQFVEVIAAEAEARPHFPPIWVREIADGGVHLDESTAREVAGVITMLRDCLHDGVRTGVFVHVSPLLVHGGIVAPLLLFFASKPLRARLEAAGIAGAAAFDRAEVVRHIQDVTIDVLRGGRRTAADPRARRTRSRSA